MSFVDLMKNNTWSDYDITNYTEAVIASEFSQTTQNILNRKLTGSLLGSYTLTPEDDLEVTRFKEVSYAAQLQGQQAKKDMELLAQILPVERAFQRLQQPLKEPVKDELDAVTNQVEVDLDVEERSAAQTLLDAASAEVMDWVVKRNPVA